MTHTPSGLPVQPGLEAVSVPRVPACPVFGVQPPSPSLWGVHPEDIADWKKVMEEANAD